MASGKTESDDNLYDGLYGDGDEFADEFAAGDAAAGDPAAGGDLDDTLDFLKEEPEESTTSAPKTSLPSTLPAPPKLESPAPTSATLPASAASSLPPRPTTATDASNALSYSAQVAAQFSQYRQTPSQERQPRLSAGQAGASADGQLTRPVRPSEMKDEGKMFVGGLSWDTTDDGLRNYFSEFGKVDACTIVRDADGKSRGFAFLTFEDPASVNAVMIREHFLDGKAIDPKRAIPREEHLRNTRYFVGGLAPQTTSESMRTFFSAFGKVVDATVMVDRETTRSKGFGFVTFEDNSSEAQLVGKLGLMLDDKQIEVKTAQPRSQRDQKLPEQRSTVASGVATSMAGGSNGVGGGVGGGGADPQQMNMLYQRMMGQMGNNAGSYGMMGGMPGMMGSFSPMMNMGMNRYGMGQAGMGAMNGAGMGTMSGMAAAGMNGGMGAGAGGMVGGMGMNGGMGAMGGGMNGGATNGMVSGMGAGAGTGMVPMAGGGMGAMGTMAGNTGPMRLGMGPMGGGAGMGTGMMGMGGMRQGMGMGVGMGMGMGVGMGMGMGMGGMSMMGVGRGRVAGAGMAAGGTGPARVMNRGQHSFHPYAR